MKTRCMSCGGSMKKMAVGGTTTKRIIKKSTGGMYGIPQENMGTSGQYGFAQKGGATKKYGYGGSTTKTNSKPTESKSQPNTPPTGTNKLKKGGATKATKFAALAPPYNKVTFADRIAGAKKKK